MWNSVSPQTPLCTVHSVSWILLQMSSVNLWRIFLDIERRCHRSGKLWRSIYCRYPTNNIKCAVLNVGKELIIIGTYSLQLHGFLHWLKDVAVFIHALKHCFLVIPEPDPKHFQNLQAFSGIGYLKKLNLQIQHFCRSLKAL